jgi:hypothetical protein
MSDQDFFFFVIIEDNAAMEVGRRLLFYEPVSFVMSYVKCLIANSVKFQITPRPSTDPMNINRVQIKIIFSFTFTLHNVR